MNHVDLSKTIQTHKFSGTLNVIHSNVLIAQNMLEYNDDSRGTPFRMHELITIRNALLDAFVFPLFHLKFISGVHISSAIMVIES